MSRDAELADLILVQHNRYLAHPGPHHAHAELVYVIRGRYRARLRGTDLDLGPSQAAYYPPGCEHHPRMRGEDLPLIYCLQWHWDEGPGPHREGRILEDPGGRLQGVLGWLWHLHGTGSSRRDLRRRLFAVVLQEVRDADRDEEPQPADPLARVHRYIHENLFHYLSMDHLVAVAEMSEAHLRRRFVARYGLPPVALARELRRQRAVELIRGTRLPLGAIARRCRYSSAAHLSRVIKAATGRCPRDLRAAG